MKSAVSWVCAATLVAGALAIPLPSGLVPGLGAAPAAAQDRYAMLVLELPASARALGTGDAFPLGAPDANALLYAPAFGSSLRGFSLDAGWWTSNAVSLSLAAGTEWWGGAIGGALQTLEYSSPLVGYDDPRTAEAGLGADAGGPVTERVASLGYARRVWELDASVTAKLVEYRLSDEAEHGVAFDAAIGRALGPVRLALAARHVGPALASPFGGDDLALPARASLSAATTRSVPVGPLDIAAAATVAVREDGLVLPAGGVELGYWPIPGRTFFVRAGVRRAGDDGSPFTFGAGFSGDALSLDWAWAPYEDSPTSGVHRFGIRLR